MHTFLQCHTPFYICFTPSQACTDLQNNFYPIPMYLLDQVARTILIYTGISNDGYLMFSSKYYMWQ